MRTGLASLRRARRGFTLAEVLISMTIGMVVIASATAFSLSSWQTRRSWTVREGVDRGARFVGLSIARDVQEAGIAMVGTPVFSALGATGDTVSVLSVPFEPAEAPVYPIFDDGDTLPNYPPGGTCGATCIDFKKVDGAYDVKAGDLVRLQVGTTRRLLLLTSVTNQGTGLFRIQFLPATRLVNRDAGIDNLLLSRSGTTMQRLHAVMYWRNPFTKELMRAERLKSTGAPDGDVIATGVQAFTSRLVFVSGAEHPTYDGLDADTTNDGNDVMGVRIRTQIKSDRSDPAVNGGNPVSRWYEWRVAPRNLLYEKNKM
ncbi:prepilin-type N-terminal cleavage/methylation domain-containing protein [Gemmatimonas sp.]|uniref:PilW family protein n=1 Tax=Gemmatimonas sp. TaxID=1962908 RepID=UPI00286B7EE8|nr:prepilin-type N-terminal cleavage/methylation domain-containing protein [Gemmatimonas sp.]